MKLSKSQTILLVEDDSDDVFWMQRALKEAKISNPLKIVTNGQAAVDYLDAIQKNGQNEPIPPLIFLDLKLPYIDGFDVLKWIRQQPALNATHVIILSSSSESRDLEQANRLGARSYLVKPPTKQMLLDLLASLKKE
jgi:CheY-like chemotaxis protein